MNKVKLFNDFINESLQYMKFGDRGEQVTMLQTAMENLGFHLDQYGVDGKFGPETLGALRRTLTTLANLTNVEAIVGDPNLLNFASDGITENQYNVAVMVGSRPEMAEQIKAKMNTQSTSKQLAALPLIQKYMPDSQQFMAKLIQISNELQIDPNWLLLVMYKECGLNPKAVSKSTGASGLIQFMPATAIGLGTSVEAIRQMSGTQQLDYVKKYLSRWSGQMKSAIDVYMTIFYPAAVNKPDSFVIGSEKSPERAQEIAKRNPAISAGKAVVVKGDFKQYVSKNLPPDLAKYA